MADGFRVRVCRFFPKHTYVAIVLVSGFVFGGLAHAGSPTNVRKLMVQPGSFTPFPHHKPRLHEIKAKNRSGDLIKVPTMAVDVFSGVPSWDTVDPTKVPNFKQRLPKNVRSHISLFYMNALGWIIVPRSWHLHWAAIGADGNSSIAFVSPKGWKNG